MRTSSPWTAATLALAAVAWAVGVSGSDYVSEVQEWRRQREARLTAEDGWLAVTGLFWLQAGDSAIGSQPGSAILLPPDAPARVGRLVHSEGRTRIWIEPGIEATLGGRPLGAEAQDLTPEGDALRVGRLALTLIRRDGRVAVRLRDPESEARRRFAGLDWFPVDPAYRVTARWVAYAPPRILKVPSVVGYVTDLPCPGQAVFRLGDRELRLEPVLESEDATELFFIFRDSTARRETYGGGRFLYTDLPRDGTLVLDFNKAYSPPCAFTNYATCPLPPRQNQLAVPIRAGEKSTGH
jgi:uncharacterized protein (DUF1684 family)